MVTETVIINSKILVTCNESIYCITGTNIITIANSLKKIIVELNLLKLNNKSLYLVMFTIEAITTSNTFNMRSFSKTLWLRFISHPCQLDKLFRPIYRPSAAKGLRKYKRENTSKFTFVAQLSSPSSVTFT